MRLFKCNLRSFLVFLDARNPTFELSRIGQKDFPRKYYQTGLSVKCPTLEKLGFKID